MGPTSVNPVDAQKKLAEFFPATAGGTEPAVRQLFACAKVVTKDQGQFIFRSGDPCSSFLVLLEGSVRVQLTAANGREVTLYRIGPGGSCILTTSCLLSREHYLAAAIAESDIVAIAIPNGKFHDALNESRHFRDFVFNEFSTRLANVIARIEQLALTSIDARLAAILISMDKSGTEKVTHQQLSVELGTAREVVSRHLKQLEKKGWVRLARGRVVVLNVGQLRNLLDASLCD